MPGRHLAPWLASVQPSVNLAGEGKTLLLPGSGCHMHSVARHTGSLARRLLVGAWTVTACSGVQLSLRLINAEGHEDKSILRTDFFDPLKPPGLAAVAGPHIDF